MDRKPDRRSLTPDEAKQRLRELDTPAGGAAPDPGAPGAGLHPSCVGAALAAGIACGRAMSGRSKERTARSESATLARVAPLLIEALLLGEAHLRRHRTGRG
ncbi:MAG: hypothetical protein IPJ41_03830 [Phycisphaerales bacterium]|nr:hypothetical protein [Phycisphaerales bacterium]